MKTLSELREELNEHAEDFREPRIKGYCNNCNEEVLVNFEDFGIGSYEYWGAKGTHHDYQAICSQCEELVENTWEE